MGGRRFWQLLLLFAAGLINFFDRSSLGIAASSIRADLHLSATQIGALLSAFSFTYGIAQLPLAAFLRPRHTRKVLGIGLLLWSTAQAAFGAVHRFGSFFAWRLVLGAGESPFYPVGVSIATQGGKKHQRARATAVLNLASMLGLAIAPPLLTGVMLRIGWRGMFVLLGAAGMLVAFAWFLVPSPEWAQNHQSSRDKDASRPSLPFLHLLRQPTMRGMMLGFGGLNYVNWFFISWLPGYLEADRHLSLRHSSWLAALPFLAGACGALLSGWFSDVKVGRGTSAERLHRSNIVTGLLCCGASTALVSSAHSAGGAVALIGAAMFCLHFAGTSAWGLVQAMAPAENVPAASALQNFGSFMMASLAPVLTGEIVDRTRSYGLALLLCATMAVVGAVCYVLFTRRPFQLAHQHGMAS